ncbi:MAG TPA: HAMP domain-containing sensor histidine kinase [Gaiellales bacterium]|jgi:signal transduction histidine kinase|nr:HAMP domain-containing sensor histidine kinase [Gaiellales bacterium]
MLQSLRARLAFLFAGTLVLATVIAGVVVVSLYQSYNRDQTTTQLQREVDGLATYYAKAISQVQRNGRKAPPIVAASSLAQISNATIYYAGPPPFPNQRRNVQYLPKSTAKVPVDLQWKTLKPGQHRTFPFTLKGTSYIGVASGVFPFGNDQVVGAVVLARPLADINNAWKNVIGLVGVGLAVGLAVALILATYVARRITHPLRVIGSAADRVARGDLDVHVIGRRPADDELGQLAIRFQGMVDRLREVDELERNFLMRVTHELRTPLTAISGHVQAVTEGVVGPDELDESLEAVNEEVRRLDRLVGDLLDLTRLEAHQFRVVREEVGLEALLERAASSFREKARMVDITFETPIEGAPTVITDGDRVLQIVNNLLDNAFRWTPRGGRVELACATTNGIAAIRVTDTGRGISPAEREAVFHPFYSRRGEGGTGLGLSISRELAQALGGRLSVESSPGTGSTFTLSLPRKKRIVGRR